MTEYIKTKIADAISVESVVTVLYNDLSVGEHGGESHDFWELAYVERGSFEVSVDNNIFKVEEGQIIIYPPLAYHIGTKTEGVKLDIVSFDCKSEAMSYFVNKVITLSDKQRRLLSQIISVGEKCFRKTPCSSVKKGMIPREETDVFTLQSLKNQLELLLLDIYVKKESTGSKPVSTNYENFNDNIFEALTNYLENNIREKLSLSDMCNFCQASPSQLKKVCKTHCGQSPVAYFISLKIETAKRMICDTDLNFTQISESLGFTTVHYFSKLFKDKAGTTPSEYAKAVHKK